MARLPFPGTTLSGTAWDAAEAIPVAVRDLLARLRDAGHATYVVGGSLRDLFLGRTPADWDMATAARPDRVLALFPGAVYENAFGTVAVRQGALTAEITTFRTDHDYADFRRPHRVEFGDDIETDLARRDFTVNALAWGGRPGEPLALVDPFGGRADLERRLLRAVGDPALRFREDALRLVRAVRLAATLGFEIEPDTLRAIPDSADLVRHLSGERVAAELLKLLGAPVPSVGLRLLQSTGLLDRISPELAAQRSVAQDKIPGEDLWDHTVRTVDAVPVDLPIVRLAALLHDIGKPATLGDGPFHGHEVVGAEVATALLRRLRFARATADPVVQLVRQHMFEYEPAWGDAAVRRFIARVGPPRLEELFALRQADDVGSGLVGEQAGLSELRARVAGQLKARAPLQRTDLAVDGDDLIVELGLTPGPLLGAILDRLLEAVLEDPGLNDRLTLLALARSRVGDPD